MSGLLSFRRGEHINYHHNVMQHVGYNRIDYRQMSDSDLVELYTIASGVDVTLRTARLLLRPLHARDIGALIAGLNDYEVARYLTVVPYPYTEADAAEWLWRQRPAVPGLAVFVVDLPGIGFIGSVSLGDELGYWLDRRYHGRGYMTEACEALLDWHFALLPKDIVPSGAHVGNEASLRVQQKLGFTDTGERVMRFVRSQQREIEHVTTRLDRLAFAAARRNLRRA